MRLCQLFSAGNPITLSALIVLQDELAVCPAERFKALFKPFAHLVVLFRLGEFGKRYQDSEIEDAALDMKARPP